MQLMDAQRPFTEQLSQAIEQRRATIDKEEIPRLKELFRVFHSSLQGLHSTFLRKSLVQQDPYKEEQKVVELKTPPDEPYMDSERDTVIGVRLDAYDNLLEFLGSYYEMRADVLNFRELKKLSDVVKYIHFDRLTTSSPLPTTRGVAELVGKSRDGNDSFANSIVSDSLDQLAKKTKEIITLIKTIGTFKREEHKLMLREQVFSGMDQPEQLQPEDEASLKKIREQFKAAGCEGPFVPELAGEVLAEDYGPQGESLREEALQRLHATAARQKRQKPKESLRDILVNALRSLAAASRPLDTIIDRLRANQELIQSQKRGFGQRFREWIDKLANRGTTEVIYNVEFVDETSGTRHSESVRFESFVEQMAKKSRLYASFLAKSGSTWTKVQSAEDDQLYNYVTKELGECHVIHRQAQALDVHIKSEAPQPIRQKMKGIKIELTGIKNATASASQLVHEYVAKKDEHEQLKKLGVDT
jgi:hypothetical protein